MYEELQKEIDRLKAENAKLARDLAGAHDDIKEVRGEARDRRHEGKKLAEQVDALTKERDEFKFKAQQDPEGLKTQVAELSGKLRDVVHRTAFAKVAQELKVSDPAKVADLYALSGYKADADEPDEAKLVETIQTALKGRPHFLDTAPGGAQTAAGAAGATQGQAGGKPGPGAERGQSVTSEGKSLAPGRIPGRL
jgi:predicted nuclease with TOPRIM domain